MNRQDLNSNTSHFYLICSCRGAGGGAIYQLTLELIRMMLIFKIRCTQYTFKQMDLAYTKVLFIKIWMLTFFCSVSLCWSQSILCWSWKQPKTNLIKLIISLNIYVCSAIFVLESLSLKFEIKEMRWKVK